MGKELVDAIEDIGPFARGAVHLVVLHPCRAAILGAVDAADADADHHFLRILRVDGDRVQAHTAEARHPLRARRLIIEALHDRPRLAAVLALEKRGRLDSGPDHVRRLLMSRLDVPGLGERAVRTFGKPGVLRRLPRLAHVAAHLDARSAPRLVHGREHRSVPRVVRGMVDLGRSELGTLARPRASPRIAAQHIETLLRSNHKRDFLCHPSPPSVLAARYRRNHVNDVAVAEWRVLPTKEARVVLVDEKREVRTKFAVFVAKALAEARMSANQPIQRLPDRPGVEGQVARATGEAAVGAVQQHPHAGTTIGGCDFRHRPPR